MEARDWERGVHMVECGQLETPSNVVGKGGEVCLPSIQRQTSSLRVMRVCSPRLSYS